MYVLCIVCKLIYVTNFTCTEYVTVYVSKSRTYFGTLESLLLVILASSKRPVLWRVSKIKINFKNEIVTEF